MSRHGFSRIATRRSPALLRNGRTCTTNLRRAGSTADSAHAAYIDAWSKSHPAVVADWIKRNPGTPHPIAGDLAVAFFETFSKEYPGRFPSSVTKAGADGRAQTVIEPVKDGADIQSIFFDLWRQDHPDADLQDVPGDLVTHRVPGLTPILRCRMPCSSSIALRRSGQPTSTAIPRRFAAKSPAFFRRRRTLRLEDLPGRG